MVPNTAKMTSKSTSLDEKDKDKMKRSSSSSSAENTDVERRQFSGQDPDNKFSSTLSTYLTLLGYSVGIADIWRFPFLAYRNGGGAFLLPFVTMILVCGIPMYFLEYSVSKFSGRGAYQLWDICPLFRGVGLTVGLAYGLYMTGSSIFRCWSIEFLFYAFQDPIPWSHCDNEWNTQGCRDNSLLINASAKAEVTSNFSSGTGSTTYHNDSFSLADINLTRANLNISLVTTAEVTQMSAAEEFWQYKVLQLSSGIDDLTPIIWRYFLYMFIYRLVILLGSIKSIKSIEKVIYVTATVPFFLTVAIFVRSLMLPGSTEGLKYFFLPDFEKIMKARVWIEATLMAFYTLAFGWGVNLLLGSHAAFKENCLRTAILLPVLDMLMAVFSGMVCFSVLGNMAHAYDVHIENVISAGMSTGMVAYVTALATLPFPQIWSGCFLISTLLTGIDSQLIPLDMIIQLFGDLFPRFKAGSRVYVLCAVSAFIMLLSFTTCTGGGAFLFLWNDWYSGAWVGPIVAFIEVTVVAWIYGMDRFNEDVYMMIGRRIPAILRLGVAFISPVTVAVIFFTSVIEYVPPKYGSYMYPASARIVGWVVVISISLPMLVQALYKLYQDDGPLLKRLRHHTRPTDSWGPCDPDCSDSFHDKKSKYDNRTFKDLLYFNVFGKYPRNSFMCDITSEEMEDLNRQ